MEQLTRQERNTCLLERLVAGDTAAESELMEENMGLVRHIARRFLDRGTEYEDLVQIGSIGFRPRRAGIPISGSWLSAAA